MPEEDTSPAGSESGDVTATTNVNDQALPPFLKARQELADNPQINEPKPEDMPSLTLAEKKTQTRLKEMLSIPTPDGEPQTLFSLVDMMSKKGDLDERINMIINPEILSEFQIDEETARENLTKNTRDSLDDFSAVNMLLREYKMEVDGLPDDESLRNVLSEFMVTQRHLVHLAGEMSASGAAGKNKELNQELLELRNKRLQLRSKIVANKDKLSNQLSVKFIDDEQEEDPETIEYPLAVRDEGVPIIVSNGTGRPRSEVEDVSVTSPEEALDKIVGIDPDELPEDWDDLTELNENMQIVLPDDIEVKDDEDIKKIVDERYPAYQRLSKRVKEAVDQNDLRLLSQATEYRFKTLKEILQNHDKWPETQEDVDQEVETLDESSVKVVGGEGEVVAETEKVSGNDDDTNEEKTPVNGDLRNAEQLPEEKPQKNDEEISDQGEEAKKTTRVFNLSKEDDQVTVKVEEKTPSLLAVKYPDTDNPYLFNGSFKEFQEQMSEQGYNVREINNEDQRERTNPAD